MSHRPSPLVSIVTPFYNTADFLEEAIESVLAQTLPDWEYILVDNCSTDGGREIAERYARLDPRIRVVVNKKFLTQVENYNAALAEISADSLYTKVVEADNWLYPECLERMVALADAHPRVGIVSAYNVTERQVRFRGLPISSAVVSGAEIARMHLISDAYLFGSPTTVLLRSDLVRARAPFFHYTYAEDLSACFDILREWDFGFVHQILTFVRTDNASIQSRLRGFDGMALDRLVVLSRHGPQFLSPPELARQRARVEKNYYRRLALGALRGQSREFWQFHRKGLAGAGIPLSYPRIVGRIATEILRAIVNPGTSAMAIFRHLTRASGA